MSAPFVSILIPCHNAAPWLATTLESALAQSWPHREIILVDDGSTDGSLALAQTFAGRGVRVFAQPNSGASAARNHAIRESHGDFLQFLDADDLISPGKLAAQLAHQLGGSDEDKPVELLLGVCLLQPCGNGLQKATL